MANAKRTLKVSTYTIVSDAVERGIDAGINRAYKHSDEPLSDADRVKIQHHVSCEIMLQLDDVIDWGYGDDD